VLTPYEAAALICEEDDEGEGGAEGEIEVLDVRTQAQREQHAINERGPGMTVRGARAAPLDEMVAGRLALPPPERRVVLVCSRGPKSLVALDWLAEACPRAVCVEGGISAWDVAKLPIERVVGPSDS
jgi:rhodanese-related sulfurtransferase